MIAAPSLLLLLACARPGAPTPAAAPDGAGLRATVESVRAAATPLALQGRFRVRLDTPGLSGLTTGALVLHAPDRLRVEVFTPLRTPSLVVATDGRSVDAYDHGGGVYYRGDDAVAVLAGTFGVGVDVADLVALLTGRLPLSGATLVAVEDAGRHRARVRLRAADGTEVAATVDLRRGLVEDLVARPEEGAPAALTVRVDGHRKVGRTWLPEDLHLEVPGLDWTLDLSFTGWDELGVIPDAFDLAPPPGAETRDLVDALRRAAEPGLTTPDAHPPR